MKPKNIIYRIQQIPFIRFFINIWLFRENLYRFRDWDYSFNLYIFKRSLEILKYNLENYSYEDETYLNPKLESINKVIELIDKQIGSDFITDAEEILGFKMSKGNPFIKLTAEEYEILKLSEELEEQNWNKIWDIIKGDPFIKGSDIRCWWN